MKQLSWPHLYQSKNCHYPFHCQRTTSKFQNKLQILSRKVLKNLSAIKEVSFEFDFIASFLFKVTKHVLTDR